MRAPRRGAGLIAGVLTAGVLMTGTHSLACQGLDANALSDVRIAELQLAGWTGDPTDHAERLYPSGCGFDN